jgi:hypothetical protein
MTAKVSTVPVACVALLVSACGSGPQSLILGKWQAASAQVGGADAGPEVGSAIDAIKMTAECNRDGTAKDHYVRAHAPGHVQVGRGKRIGMDHERHDHEE